MHITCMYASVLNTPTYIMYYILLIQPVQYIHMYTYVLACLRTKFPILGEIKLAQKSQELSNEISVLANRKTVVWNMICDRACKN